MRRRAIVIVAVICLLLSTTAFGKDFKNPVKQPGIDIKTIELLLKRGQVLIVETNAEGRPKLTTGGILINAPKEKVWDVISDFEQYKEYMPSTENVEVIRREGNTVDAKFHIIFKFSVLEYDVSYTNRHVLNAPNGYTWELLEGDIDDTYGGWELIAIDDSHTAAFYSVYSDIRSIGWVVRKVLESDPSFEVAVNSSTVILVLEKVKERIENPEKSSGGSK